MGFKGEIYICFEAYIYQQRFENGPTDSRPWHLSLRELYEFLRLLN